MCVSLLACVLKHCSCVCMTLFAVCLCVHEYCSVCWRECRVGACDVSGEQCVCRCVCVCVLEEMFLCMSVCVSLFDVE